MAHSTAVPSAAPAGALARLSARLGALAFGWRLLLALLAGAVLAAAQEPFALWPLIFPCFSLLVWLLDAAAGRWRRLATLLAFLWGYFAAGLYWIGIAFFVDAERFALLVPFPVLGVPLLLSAVMLPACLPFLWRWPGGVRRVILLALALAAGDWLRSWLFTGFPWNLFGYVWLGAEPVLQSVGWIGIHGLGVLTVAFGALPAILADPPALRPWGGARLWLGGFALLFATLAAFGLWRLAAAGPPQLTGIVLRVVQPNVPQAEKWAARTREAHYLRTVALTAGSLASGAGDGATGMVAVWPETAIPYFLAEEPQRRAQLVAAVPPGGLLLAGAPRLERIADGRVSGAWNSLHAIGEGGVLLADYDKRHLVPFGEYLPLRALLGRLGLDKLTHGGGDFSEGTGPGVLAVGDLPPFRALICYEGIFPAEIAEGERRPEWLLNVTNDAWFGDSSGPYQHFGMTRLRAIEQGLPLVRSANTGISAIVDPYGRVLARLDLGETGVLEGRLPAALAAPPPYARLGDWLSLLPVALLLLLFLAGGRKHGRRDV